MLKQNFDCLVTIYDRLLNKTPNKHNLIVNLY